MARLASIDLVVLVFYALVVVAIGVWANRRQKTTEDYFLGGRHLRWWAVGISLIATSFSSAALVGGTGFGFTRGLAWLQLQIGDLVAVAIACSLFLPFFSGLGLTTAYGYLDRRFGRHARRLASALFLVQTLLRTGVLVLGPALAIAAVSDLDLGSAILLSGAVAILYSAFGGIQAVVWTDLIQMGVVLIGVVLCLGLAASDVPGGLGALLEHAGDRGRLEPVSLGLDLSTPFSLVGALLAYGTLALSIAGTNQQAVQRYLSTKDLASARRAALLGWGIGFVAVSLTLLLGAALGAWADLAPNGESYRQAMDLAILERRADEALPRFLVTRLPAGLAGLLVAAIFAASMSSMDSAIHSMSTATLVDFVRPLRRRARSEKYDLRLARGLTALYGLLALAAAFLAARQGRQMLDQLIVWLGYVAGPLLGLFLLGVLTTRSTERGALLGGLAGVLLVVLAVVLGLPARYAVHPLWLAPLSLLVTVLAGRSLSLLDPPPAPERIRGLTWWTRS